MAKQSFCVDDVRLKLGIETNVYENNDIPRHLIKLLDLEINEGSIMDENMFIREWNVEGLPYFKVYLMESNKSNKSKLYVK